MLAVARPPVKTGCVADSVNVVVYGEANFYTTISQSIALPFRRHPYYRFVWSSLLPAHSLRQSRWPRHLVPNKSDHTHPGIIDGELDLLLAGLGAVSIDGAKAVGKTATAMRRVARTVRLDREAEAAVVRADPDAAIRDPFPVFFDEWQHVPAIWDAVRRRVDEDSTPGLVVLAGYGTLGGVFRDDPAGREAAAAQILAACKEFKIPCGFPTNNAAEMQQRMKEGWTVHIMQLRNDDGFAAVETGRTLGVGPRVQARGLRRSRRRNLASPADRRSLRVLP